ncbi:MAG: SusD/RagB family nutrient-binding outer membrane lipoprotein [Gemmatimonadetes bacterium]|nr:SusD/RagB family nutrient-binding outer membrane lipoprotein [Gemmatimonadota bacterium]
MRTRTMARVVGLALLALPAAACEFISPTESNPNAVPTANVDQLFTGIEVNTYFVAEGQLSRLSSMWIQQMTGTDRQFKTLDNYVLTEEDAAGEFSTIYTGGGLQDLKNAIAQATSGGRRVYAGILKIHQAYMFGMAASVWGDIPYSEAANPAIATPKLDKQADVYAAVQKLLDEAISDLASGAGAGPGAVDFNFSGNAARWTAVARTLKARFYLHLAEVSGNTAYQSALAEAQQGIAANAGNWRAIHSTDSKENNLWYQFMRDRSGYIGGGDYLVPSMVARADSRLPFYYSQSGGTYRARASLLSTQAGGYGALDYNSPIATCAENAYIRAEAQYRLGNVAGARTAATDGLVCEEGSFAVSLTALKGRITAASGQALLDEIMLQKYTALFLNIEAWNDWKRTCLPKITQRPAGMPARLFYGQDERQTNPNIPAVDKQPKRNANDPNACT